MELPTDAVGWQGDGAGLHALLLLLLFRMVMMVVLLLRDGGGGFRGSFLALQVFYICVQMRVHLSSPTMSGEPTRHAVQFVVLTGTALIATQAPEDTSCEVRDSPCPEPSGRQLLTMCHAYLRDAGCQVQSPQCTQSAMHMTGRPCVHLEAVKIEDVVLSAHRAAVHGWPSLRLCSALLLSLLALAISLSCCTAQCAVSLRCGGDRAGQESEAEGIRLFWDPAAILVGAMNCG